MLDETARAWGEALITTATWWTYAGLGVAAVFLAWGIDRVEPNARRAWTFRPLLVPGIVLLWPLVLGRWAVLEARAERPLARHRPPRGFHRVAAWGLAAGLPILLIAGLLARQTGPTERPPELLSPPAEEPAR
ncbi:MAG: hypothetical protein ACFBRM_06285 [Pikeienuella sp.]